MGKKENTTIICNFWSWTKLSLDDGHFSLINFLISRGLGEGRCCFLSPLFTLGPPFSLSIYMHFCFYLSKKRKRTQEASITEELEEKTKI